MIVIACVDNDFGMMFNNRRLSRDSVLTDEILSLSCGKTIWMSPYSAKLFEEKNAVNIKTSDDFMNESTQGDYCFVENIEIAPFVKHIEKIILFKWNRTYPSDYKFIFPLSPNHWVMCESKEFAGSSHKKITREVYISEK